MRAHGTHPSWTVPAGAPVRWRAALALVTLLAGGGFAPGVRAQTAQPEGHPRLALWVTAPLGAGNAAHCSLAVSAPESPPDLTEANVLTWHPASASWRIDVHGLDARVRQPANHCFVLALDGRYVHGVILPPQSARLIRFPTLLAETRGGGLTLRLNAAHGGTALPLGYTQLDAILQGRRVP